MPSTLSKRWKILRTDYSLSAHMCQYFSTHRGCFASTFFWLMMFDVWIFQTISRGFTNYIFQAFFLLIFLVCQHRKPTSSAPFSHLASNLFSPSTLIHFTFVAVAAFHSIHLELFLLFFWNVELKELPCTNKKEEKKQKWEELRQD